MKNLYLIVFLLFALGFEAQAQCPGCVPNTVLCQGSNGPCPNYMDTATSGQAYEDTMTFFLPKQVDATVQSGGLFSWVDFLKFEILSISGLPFGINWECTPSNCTYFPSQFPNGTFACIRFCGTPLAAPGTYTLTIDTKGTVQTPFGAQAGNEIFTIDLVVLPPVGGNSGFSFSPSTGCAPLTVQFTNQNPSNGYQPGPQNLGYQYSWDFGNGLTSNAENPAPIVYGMGGNYPITYQAVIDTLPFLLQSLTVNTVNCTDIPFFGDHPDLYLRVLDASGNLLMTTNSNQVNFPPGSSPHTWNINLPVLNGPLAVEIMDSDGGLYGNDDNCYNDQTGGYIISLTTPPANQYNVPVVQSFNQNGLSFSYTMQKTAFVLTSSDTLTVNTTPPFSLLSVSPGTTACQRDSVRLEVYPGFAYEWYQDDTVLVSTLGSYYYALTAGNYKVKIIDPNTGCFTWSGDTNLIFQPSTPPGFPNVGISLNNGVLSSNLSGTWTYQWIFWNGSSWNPIAPPLGSVANLTPTQSGNYALIATNSFGCGDTSNVITFGDAGMDSWLQNNIVLYPNPASREIHIRWPGGLSGQWEMSLNDLSGRSVQAWTEQVEGGQESRIGISLPAGTYMIRGNGSAGHWIRRLVVK